ncbi:MAG: DMT family transporter [Dehalococcoidia bacterium]|nr:DMT family transporter [Dehalococcoidia bacterium]
MRPIHLLALAALSLIWGASFMFIKVMLDELTPIAIAWARLAGGGLLIGAVVASLRRGLPRSRVYWRDVAVVGLFGSAIPMVLIPWGEREIPSNLAAVLNGAMPFGVAILSTIFLPAERLTKGKAVGVTIGFVGLAVIIGPDALDLRSGSTQGQLAVVAAAMSYAAGAVFTRRRLLGVDTTTLAGAQNTMALLMLTPLLFLAGDPPNPLHLEGRTVAAALGLALLSQGVAVILYFWLLSNVEATQASFVTYLAPIAAQFWGWLVLNEVPALALAPGLSLIILGIVVVNRSARAPVQVSAPQPASASAADPAAEGEAAAS